MYYFGIIGCGNRGNYLSKLIRKQRKDFKLVVVYDHDAQALKDMYNEKEVMYTNDLNRLFSFDLNFVIIASMNHLHMEHFKAANLNDVKIFCEKPLVTTEEDIEQITELYKSIDDADIKIGTGFVLRHSPFYTDIKKIIDNGDIGDVFSINVSEYLNYAHGAFINQNWRRFSEKSGGHIVEKAVHIVDLMNWYADSTSKYVSGFGSNLYWKEENKSSGEELKVEHEDKGLFEKYKLYEEVDPYTSEKTINDTMVCNMVFKNGIIGNLNIVTYAPNSKREFTITGSKGKIEAVWETNKADIKIITRGYGKKDKSSNPSVSKCISRMGIGCHGLGDDEIVKSLIKMVALDVPMKPSFMEAINSTKTCIKLEKAIETKTVVEC